MSDPLVCCIMLTRDRPEMARRAVECFRAQTYTPRMLVVYDTGIESDGMFDGDLSYIPETPDDIPETPESKRGYILWMPGAAVTSHHLSIGALRNEAARLDISRESDILAHWDDDDHSHPSRLAEQVALLQVSGADCVGYRDMLFYDETPGHACGAWLYTNPIAKYALGTSLMYWRRTWERVPFDDVQKGEDERFCRKVGNVVAVSSMGDEPPRMIASVHGGNTSSRIAVGHQQFKRVPEWDGYCREKMRMEVAK